MAKSILTNIHEYGRICDVVDEGDEFEVHRDFSWFRVNHDNIENLDKGWTWTRDEDDNISVHEPIAPEEDDEFIEESYKIARGIAYKSVGEQLDMIYKELQQSGTLSANGSWASHITNVKSEIPKRDVQAVLRYYETNRPSANTAE